MTSGLHSFGTFRTRAGIVADNLLFYATGGLAIANIDFRTSYSDPFISEANSFSDTRLGWTAGVGTEWALWGNFSLKSEVLYLTFGEKDHSFFSPVTGRTFGFTTVDSMWLSRVGLNYKF